MAWSLETTVSPSNFMNGQLDGGGAGGDDEVFRGELLGCSRAR